MLSELPSAEQMAAMSPAEFAELEAIVDLEILEEDRLRLEDSLVEFLMEAWPWVDPAAYVHNWHIEAEAEHLEAVTRGRIKRLGMNVPPRSLKSTLTGVIWVAWTWAQRDISYLSGPQVQWFFSSYAQDLSEKDALKLLRLISSPWYQKRWGHRFKITRDGVRKIENNKGGYRLSTSVGGQILGDGGAIIVVDDPLNAKESNSATSREVVRLWWDEAMPTRLNDLKNGAKVIIMQRLHEDDLCGHIMAKESAERWDWLVIPMRYDPSYAEQRQTSLGWEDPRTYFGELMWPERWDETSISSLETDLGPYAASAQLQQTPTPRGGGIIQSEWWQLYDEESARAECGVAPQAGGALAYPPLSYVLISVDTAYKEGEQNDYNACSAWGVWHNSKGWPRVILMECWRWRGPLVGERLEGQARIEAEAAARRPGEFPKHWGLTERILDTARRRRADMILIEDKTRGVDLGREIQRLLRPGEMTVRLEPVVGDKVSRLHATVPLFADKMVWAPEKAWAQAMIDEVSQVPKGRHDDMADTAAQSLLYLRANHLVRLGTEADEEEAERARFRPMAQAPYDV